MEDPARQIFVFCCEVFEIIQRRKVMELNGINALTAIKDNKKAEQTQETPKMAFINSAFGFGFSDNNTNSGASAAFQA